MAHPENSRCSWIDEVTDAACTALPLYIVYSDAEPPDTYVHTCVAHLPSFLLPCRNEVYMIAHPPAPMQARRIREK